jgi:hypothetical protein
MNLRGQQQQQDALLIIRHASQAPYLQVAPEVVHHSSNAVAVQLHFQPGGVRQQQPHLHSNTLHTSSKCVVI